MKKDILKVGQDVWIINRNLTIEKKKIFSVINEESAVKYRINSYTCEGLMREDFFTKESKAKRIKKEFIDSLEFREGDLILFKYREYGGDSEVLGRIKRLTYCKNNPYDLESAYKNNYQVNEKDFILKVKNEYIENYEDLSELMKKYNEKEIELSKIKREIEKEHERLEIDLGQKFKKQSYWWNRKKPLFEDRFHYRV